MDDVTYVGVFGDEGNDPREEGGGVHVGVEAHLGVPEASPDAGPVGGVVDLLLEPGGVIADAVLLVGDVGQGLGGGGVRDDEGEDGEGDAGQDEDHEEEQVDAQEDADAEEGGHQRDDRHRGDEDAEAEDGLVEELEAHLRVLGGEPRAQPGHAAAQEGRHEVEEDQEEVAEARGHGYSSFSVLAVLGFAPSLSLS